MTMIRSFLTTKKGIIASASLGLGVLLALVIFSCSPQEKTGTTAKAEKETHKEAHKEKHKEGEEKEEGKVKLDAEAIRQAGIEVAAVTMGPMKNKVLLTGELVFNEEKMARVSSRIAGRIVKIVVDYGAQVRQGDALAVIDSVELGQAQAAFLQAAAGYNVAQKAFARARLLWEGKAISQAEFQERQAKFELAQAEQDYAENRLHLLGLSDADIARMLRGKQKKGPSFHAEVDTTFPLRSPISGQVVDRMATPGLVVKPDEELFTVADPSTLWGFVQIPEKDLPLIHPGSNVVIRVSALPQEEFPGRIDYIAPTVDKTTRMTRARVKVNNSRGLLKAGMFADIQVTAGERVALSVPETAVLTAGEVHYVFVEEEPGEFEKRVIKPGLKAGGRIEILKGLTAGDKVVVQGAFTLKSELEKESLEAE